MKKHILNITLFGQRIKEITCSAFFLLSLAHLTTFASCVPAKARSDVFAFWHQIKWWLLKGWPARAGQITFYSLIQQHFAFSSLFALFPSTVVRKCGAHQWMKTDNLVCESFRFSLFIAAQWINVWILNRFRRNVIVVIKRRSLGRLTSDGDDMIYAQAQVDLSRCRKHVSMID